MDPNNRRLVLRYVTGPWAGLRQIHGTVGQMFEDTGLGELPQRVDNVDFTSHHGSAMLVGQRNHYVLYTEMAPVSAVDPDPPALLPAPLL